MPPSTSASEEEHPAPVGDDESDAEPGRARSNWGGSLFQLCILVEPLPGEPHQDQARQADEEKREVAEPKQPGLAARQQERGRARQQGAEDDGRADEVQEEREALVVGSDRGEHLRHPASRSCR